MCKPKNRVKRKFDSLFVRIGKIGSEGVPIRRPSGSAETSRASENNKLCLTIHWICNLLQPFIRQLSAWGMGCFGTGEGSFLKINANTIPETGLDLRFEKDGEWFRQRLPGTDAGDFLSDCIDVVCSVTKTRENVFVEGDIAVAGRMPCSRCLEETRLSLRSSFHYTFAPSSSLPQENVELSATDLDFAYYEGEEIDLDDAILEQALLLVPVKPLCAESCRGLCPRCGANLNVKRCDCRDERIDERFAVLKQFKATP